MGLDLLFGLHCRASGFVGALEALDVAGEAGPVLDILELKKMPLVEGQAEVPKVNPVHSKDLKGSSN